MAISYFFCEFPNCDVRTHWVLTPECIVTFNHYIRQCTCIAFLLGVKSIFNLWFSKKRSIGKGKRDKRAFCSNYLQQCIYECCGPAADFSHGTKIGANQYNITLL